MEQVGITRLQKNRNGWLVCSCPFSEFFHKGGRDKNPSFFVRINPTGFSGFNCFTCHQKGGLNHFFNKLGTLRGEDYNHLAIRVMLEETPDKFEEWDDRILDTSELVPLDKTVHFRIYPSVIKSDEAMDYLTERDISVETAKLLKLRFDPDERRILFPVFDNQNRLFGFSGRSILKESPNRKLIKVKDYLGLKKERLLLGEQFVSDKPILLVEGLFALANMYEIGVDEFCTPLATMGSRLTRSQANILIDHDLPVYLLYDNDIAGRQGIYGPYDRRLGKHLGGGALDDLSPHLPVYACEYPNGVDDPDNLTYKQVRRMIQNFA